MVGYLKTKKGYFNKLKKNGKKKGYHTKNKTRKNKTRKNKTRKMIGGTLPELENLEDFSRKTIVLVGELHTVKSDRLEYDNIIRKQKFIIDLVKSKFGSEHTYFYSEAPEEIRTTVLTTNNIHSGVVVQYAQTQIPIKLSSITCDDRDKSNCDSEYASDILSIFDNSSINCIIAQLGLLHIAEIKNIISQIRPDIKIIVVNTVSERQFLETKEAISRTPTYLSLLELVKIETPYEYRTPEEITRDQKILFEKILEESRASRLGATRVASSFASPTSNMPRETFTVEVLQNERGNKVYKCLICNSISGEAVVKIPTDISLFPHAYNCPNKNKIPIEPV
jgi:hypothetical protein